MTIMTAENEYEWDTDSAGVRDSGSRKLTRGDQRELMRALAVGEVKRAALARQYGVSSSYVTKFAKTYAREIDAIRADLDDEYAGLWIADKAVRLLAHQADYESAQRHPRRDHFEWVRVRSQILHMVAEELGQLPPRATVAVVPVVHIIENVDLEALR